MEATSAGVLTTGTVSVLQFEWSGNGNATDTLTIVDNKGRTVWQAIASGVQYDLFKNYGKPVPINGINVTQISSGKVVIHYV